MAVQCNACGRFSKIVDSYTPFGGANDSEPPDDVLLCQECVDKEMAMYRKWNMMPAHWIPAKYEKRLAKEFGYEWHVDQGNAWGMWRKE